MSPLESSIASRPGILISWACLLATSFVLGAEPSPSFSKNQAPSFATEVTPFLSKYCIKCHGEKKPKGGVNLAKFKDEDAITANQKLWHLVLENVEAGDMPPDGARRPSRAEVEQLVQWNEDTLAKLDCGREIDPGRVTMRRLNRAEYNNTIRDLLGIDFHPADDFPSDDVGYGFDNIGDVLTLPPLLMEKYLEAAETIARQAIVTGTTAEGPLKAWDTDALPSQAGGVPIDGARVLTSRGQISVDFTAPYAGEYTLKARAFGQQAGPEPARMAFLIDGKAVAQVDVSATHEQAEVYEAKARLEAGHRRFSVSFLNDYYNPKSTDPKLAGDRNLVVESLELHETTDPKERKPPESHTRILFKSPTRETRDQCVREIIERFASRAFRRPVTPGEVARLVKLVDLVEQSGDSFEQGIQVAVEAVLVSPQFLFRVEIDPRRQAKDKSPVALSHPINDFELASRLSYFLYSSLPDDELWQLALAGKLKEGDNLEKQVRRMLRDPKSRALVDQFATQWLQIRNLKSANPDRKQFPAFDEPLREAMQEETERFFEHVMREDQSILDFIEADYTFLNERLAQHYGIPKVEGTDFRRVSLGGNTQRGGILTQASILTVTSDPSRTSPVKRGKWILEQILGTPPPPPPPDVPELKEDGAQLSGSLRQRMEQHRSNPSCASCHARMDPLGFAFENYNAIGAWRDQDGPYPVDSSGTLPSGQSFEGPEGLKAILKEKRENFARCLAEKMLTFAIGRGMEEPDRCSLDLIVSGLESDEYRFSRLVLEIVKSEPFQKRKNRGFRR